MIVVHLSGQQQKVAPLFEQRKFGRGTAEFLLHQLLQTHQCTFVGKEVHTAAENASHPAEMLYPFGKTGFKFGFGRNGDDDAAERIDRHQEFGYHHFAVSTFQQTFGKVSEKRIDNIGLAVQTDHYIRSLIFLNRMYNPRSNVQIVAAYHRHRYIGGSGNHCGFFEIPLALQFLILRAVIVINHIQGNHAILLLGIFDD